MRPLSRTTTFLLPDSTPGRYNVCRVSDNGCTATPDSRTWAEARAILLLSAPAPHSDQQTVTGYYYPVQKDHTIAIVSELCSVH